MLHFCPNVPIDIFSLTQGLPNCSADANGVYIVSLRKKSQTRHYADSCLCVFVQVHVYKSSIDMRYMSEYQHAQMPCNKFLTSHI